MWRTMQRLLSLVVEDKIARHRAALKVEELIYLSPWTVEFFKRLSGCDFIFLHIKANKISLFELSRRVCLHRYRLLSVA